MRLEPRAGERIDRSKAVSFTFAGWKVTGFEGDTIASAAFAAGKRVFSRSFKYHRPRGLLCCSGHCPNCQMTVDGVPNVRVCTEPIREGAVVEGQNVRWSLDFDFMSLTDKVGGPFTPVGFYYRTFIRPRAAWPLYEKFLRSAAGLGQLDPHAGHTRRYDTEHRRARVLVVGGGEAGRAAALEAAKAGPGVVLVDEDSRLARPLARRRRGARAGARARNLGGRARPVDAGTIALSLPRRADRRRHRRDRAAARLPRERPRRRDAPRRRSPPHPRLLDQARRARGRARLRRRDARDRGRARPTRRSRS